ncbi:interferon-induced protein with tetratricopeptide repeats 5-like [Brienomyrus brachyistius]|uniref:interferon-induced protein with tetratricopeptide repeats 5-like n=1 Tax=Brienomyrus brachyistius TaxID=42636 RepID=UPI0020B2F31B|nr:interferon-induced protein with tetratricopeptide repeats 5-like [Brienomyrus brachyistius]
MEAKLKRLECPFTWNINESDIKDLCDIREKLLDRVKFGPRRYHATYLNILGFVSHLQGDNERALEFLLKGQDVLTEDRKADTEFLVNFANLSWVYYHSGNLKDSAAYLSKVEEICKGVPGSSQYSCSLPVIDGEKGWTLLKLAASFYDRARKSFQKALQGDPDNVSYSTGYAVALYRIEGMNRDTTMKPESSEAVSQLRRLLLLEPDDSEIKVLLALKLQSSSKQESLRLIEDALRLSPAVPQVTRYVAKYLRAEGSTEESLEILRKAVKMAPNSSFLYHQIGLCHRQQLIQMLQTDKATKYIPVARKRDKTEECIYYFRKAVELKPSNIHAQVSLAEAYAENRELLEAEKIFTDLLKDDSLQEPDKQHCHTRYGVFLLYKMKAEDQAVAQFRIAYQMQIKSSDRMQAGKKLRQIAERWTHGRRRVREASEILAFLSAMDRQMQVGDYAKKSSDSSSESDDLTAAFAEKMKLK